MLAGISAFVLAGSVLVNDIAYAAPVFSRTQEEWDKLRDNTLEYAEIPGLIEEYNATVKKNQIELNDFKKKYGRTNASASDRYNKTADEILANLVEPDVDSPSYAASLAGRASSLAAVDNLRKSADTSLEDYDVNYLNFELAKMSLVQIAQINRINLDNAKLGEELAALQEKQASLDVQYARARVRSGVATNLEVLNAEERLMKAQKDVQDAVAETENIRQKLMIMCGWSYDAHPEFAALPTTYFEEMMARFSLEEDTPKAIANNYTLQANEKRRNNAKSQSQKDSLDKTIEGNKSGIANAVRSSYQSLTAAKENLEYAKNNANLQTTNLSNIAGKYGLGMVSAYEMESAKLAKEMADITKTQSELALYIAIHNYQWTVAGLAKTE